MDQELDHDSDSDSDSDSESDLSFDSDDGLSSDSDNEDSTGEFTNVKGSPTLDIFEGDNFMTEEIDTSINYQALSNKERLLPLNMLTSDAYQAKILERAHKTNGRLVKDLNKVFDVNLTRFYNELDEVQDPMAHYFANYIEQRTW